jgi:hypothetical protein
MRVKTIFLSSEKSDLNSELEFFANTSGELFISIYLSDDNIYQCSICLDKETAIKFSKVVRREISFLNDEEGLPNG